MSITVYTLPTWPHCIKAEEFLSSLGVPFDIKDISKDKEFAMYIIKKTRQMGVPVIEINNKFVIEFNEEKINSILLEEKII